MNANKSLDLSCLDKFLDDNKFVEELKMVGISNLVSQKIIENKLGFLSFLFLKDSYLRTLLGSSNFNKINNACKILKIKNQNYIEEINKISSIISILYLNKNEKISLSISESLKIINYDYKELIKIFLKNQILVSNDFGINVSYYIDESKFSNNTIVKTEINNNQNVNQENTNQKSEFEDNNGIFEHSNKIDVENIKNNIIYESFEQFFVDKIENPDSIYKNKNVISMFLKSQSFANLAKYFSVEKNMIKNIIYKFYETENQFLEYYFKYLNPKIFGNNKSQCMKKFKLSEISYNYIMLWWKNFGNQKFLSENDEEKILDYYELNYKNKYINTSILEYLDKTQNNDLNQIVKAKMQGKTLEEIGKLHSLTKERIRQKINTFINNADKTIEFKYIDLFEKYEIDYDLFNKITNLPIESFNYIKDYLVDNKTKDEKMSNLDLLKLINDDEFTNFYLNKNELLIIDDKIIKKNKKSILEYIVQNNKEKIHVDEIFKIYTKKFENNNSDDEANVKRQIDGILSRSLKTLCLPNYNYIFYDIEQIINDKEILKYLNNMLNVEDGIYSSLYFLSEHSEIFKNININNEYELHNLLRKIIDNPKITFGRMPTINIGAMNEIEFYDKLIHSFGKIKEDDFVEFVYENYGHKPSTLKGCMTQKTTAIRENGYLISKIYLENKEDFIIKQQIKTIFSTYENDLISYQEIKNIYEKNNIDISKLTQYFFSETKYNVHNNWLIKKGTSIEKLKLDFFVEKEFYIDEFYEYTKKTPNILFSKELESLDVIEVQKGYYTNWERFNKKYEISKQEIFSLSDLIHDVVYQSKIVSLKQILEKFDNSVLDTINKIPQHCFINLMKRIKKIWYHEFDGNIVFSLSNVKNVDSLLEEQFLDNDFINCFKVKKVIDKKLGLDIDFDEVINLLSKTKKYFFMKKLEMLYKTKEIFFKEAYKND